MELLIGIIIGAVVTAAGFVSAMRRACKKPQGSTAKVMAAVSGGGGGPDPRVP